MANKVVNNEFITKVNKIDLAQPFQQKARKYDQTYGHLGPIDTE